MEKGIMAFACSILYSKYSLLCLNNQHQNNAVLIWEYLFCTCTYKVCVCVYAWLERVFLILLLLHSTNHHPVVACRCLGNPLKMNKQPPLSLSLTHSLALQLQLSMKTSTGHTVWPILPLSDNILIVNLFSWDHTVSEVINHHLMHQPFTHLSHQYSERI